MFSYALRSLSAILTVLYLLVSAGSCTVPAGENEASLAVPGVAGPLETAPAVHILQSRPEISLPLQRAAERYAASTGEGIAFHVQTVSGEDYRATLRSKLLAGEQVDLFHLLDADDVDRLSPLLENLSVTLPWVTGAAVDTLSPVTLDGAVFGVPYALEGVGLIVNRRVFEAAGIALTDVHDFESMSEAFFALRDQIDASELAEDFPDLTAVTDLSAQDTAYLGGVFSEVLLDGAFSSPFSAYRSPALLLAAPDETESFLKLFARVSAQRTNWSGFPAVSEQRMVEGGLAAGRVAVILHSTEIYRRVLATSPEMEGALALMPVYLENRELGAVYVGAPVWWAVRESAGSDIKRQACGLLTWLYQTREGGEILAEEFGLLSPYRDTAASTGVALHSQLLSAVEQETTLPQLAPQAPSGWGDVFAAQLGEYFTVYDKDWAELTSACQDAWMAGRE